MFLSFTATTYVEVVQGKHFFQDVARSVQEQLNSPKEYVILDADGLEIISNNIVSEYQNLHTIIMLFQATAMP